MSSLFVLQVLMFCFYFLKQLFTWTCFQLQLTDTDYIYLLFYLHTSQKTNKIRVEKYIYYKV